nr:integrase, catalytic region, zinc finger, CCHC-type, peptidase aspartic, catalytic [Tanacetum cinerariifolium]
MNMLTFGMIGTKSVKNANSTKFHTIKPTMTCNKRSNSFKLSWEISRVSDQKDTSRGTSANTKFAKQSIVGKPPKVGETHALSKPVTSNSIPTPQGSKVVKNDKVIAPGMFRINPFKPSREAKHVPNKVRARVGNTKTRKLQPRSNTKNDRVPSAFKSSRCKNKEVEVEEHHRKLLLSRNKKYMSSECNNIKLATQNAKSKVVCTMCKQCLIYVNHDKCLLNYVNGMTSRGKKQKANVSINEKQKKQQPKVKKTKKVGSIEKLASPKPSKPRSFLRWSPTGRMFDLKGKIIASSESESQSDCSKGDNACTSNPLEPTIKRFLNSTFSLAGQFYDSDLEVAFRRNAYFFRNLEGVDLLSGYRTTNLYTINLHEMASSLQLKDKENHGDHERLDLPYALLTISTQKPTEGELDLLFEAMYDDHVGGQPAAAPRTALAAQTPQVLQTPSATTTTADTAPTTTNLSSQATNIPNTSQDVDEIEMQ